MRVTFLMNLGTRDAENHGIEDVKKCVEGNEVDLPDEQGNWLVEAGIATSKEGGAIPKGREHEHAHGHASTHEHEKHGKK